MSAVLKQIETPSPLAEKFKALGIETVTWAHPPVFTVDEGLEFKHLIPGGHTKNLFLKDKKDQLWLLVALDNTVIDLKWLPKRIDAARLSFGNADLLLEVLGITPGSVTPFALVNDVNRRVRPVLDARMLACDVLNYHPLKNDKTTAIKPEDLLKFMRDLGYDPRIVDFE